MKRNRRAPQGIQFARVVFEDGITYDCPVKRILSPTVETGRPVVGQTCTARWKDGVVYPGTITAVGCTREELQAANDGDLELGTGGNISPKNSVQGDNNSSKDYAKTVPDGAVSETESVEENIFINAKNIPVLEESVPFLETETSEVHLEGSVKSNTNKRRAELEQATEIVEHGLVNSQVEDHRLEIPKTSNEGNLHDTGKHTESGILDGEAQHADSAIVESERVQGTDEKPEKWRTQINYEESEQSGSDSEENSHKLCEDSEQSEFEGDDLNSSEESNSESVFEESEHSECEAGDLEKSEERSVNLSKESKHSDSLHDHEISECSNTDSESDEEATFGVCKKKENGQRLYDKKHCCYFCDRMYAKLGRHLETHRREPEVGRMLAYPVRSKERSLEILKLERLGDFYFNIETLISGKGSLITLRRPAELDSKRYSVNDYTPCPECFGFVVKTDLWRHLQRCPLNEKKITDTDEGTERKKKRQALTESSLLIQPSISSVHNRDFHEEILSSMMDDEIADIVKRDTTILHLGLNIYEKFGKSQKSYISQTMRSMGRYLQVLQELSQNPLKDLMFFMDCSQFDLLLTAVSELCKTTINERGAHETGIPSLALNIGYRLRKGGKIMQGQALRHRDDELKKKAKDFLALLDLEWTNKVSTKALRTLYNRKMNKSTELPLTEDLLKLKVELKNKTESLVKSLKLKPDAYVWLKLAKVLLSRVVMFNKRRGGEAADMLVSEFNSNADWRANRTQETENSLTPLELQLCNRLTLIEIRGKRGNKVPVLLQPDIKAALDVLVATREEIGINRENPFVFSRPFGQSANHLRGPDALRDVVKESVLKKPERITSTNMRKYIATVVQVCDLTENEIGWLAKHLGHNIRVHHDFYRLHESTTELAKVSRLLIAADKGHLSKYSGKSLDSITINDFSDVESEPESEADLMEGVTAKLDCNKQKSSNEEKERQFKPANSLEGGWAKAGKPLDKQKKNCEMWSNRQKQTVMNHFKNSIKKLKIPGKVECEDFLAKYGNMYRGRDWKAIKFCVYNIIVTCKRKMGKSK